MSDDICEYAELGSPVCPAAAERDRLRRELAEFRRLYRGQIANNGSYPDHLFTADAVSEVQK
jgi:hypothetical protein